MPVPMYVLEECFTPSQIEEMWVPMGDLIRPGWWVEGGEFEFPDDPYPSKSTYSRFGPYETIELAIQKKNELFHGRWRIAKVNKRKWGCGMLPYPQPGEFERT